MQNEALLIIDMINDFNFKDGSLLAEKANKLAPSILSLKKRFKKYKKPIIYINDHYQVKQADFKKISTICTNALSKPIIELLLPEDDDYFLLKPKHSAFYGTSLDDLLHQLKVETLTITGIAGNICVLFTANDAYMREYELIIPSDCIGSASEQDHIYSLYMMKEVLKANTNHSKSILT
ncbi:isochorismatase family cysteine hydrolase [Litchfieldia alkalitelluris]|uniref:isochorismatase family cysteine hydrolase n=1 Tax=Litchfieldia alkalitelluris TaxID=304268 RepID=UPI000998D1EB|nr:isochorismatase family cysteine hydrolase [Litchfieldia alkalitelluris]